MYKSVVGIYGAPRSGTSWLGQLFDSAPNVKYQMHPFYSWQFRDKLHPRSTKEEIDAYFRSVYQSEDPYLRQVDRRAAGVYPTWSVKSDHPDVLVYKEVTTIYLLPILLQRASNFKAVVIVRNPFDAMTSWYNDKKDCRKEWDFEKEWYFAQSRNELQAESYYGFHKWKEATHTFYEVEKAFPDKVLRITYEELYDNTTEVVERLFWETGCAFSQQTESFIWNSTHSSNPDTFSVFRDHQTKEKTGSLTLPDSVKEIMRQELQWFPAASYYGYTESNK